MNGNSQQDSTRGTLHAQMQGAATVSKLHWELVMVPQMDRQVIAQ